ncbi:MAG: hypothetical protein MJE77_02450 [Proteobacteria bacterium]|nr:hypothetical protein [Pseudomonadota bacterium]
MSNATPDPDGDRLSLQRLRAATSAVTTKWQRDDNLASRHSGQLLSEARSAEPFSPVGASTSDDLDEWPDPNRRDASPLPSNHPGRSADPSGPAEQAPRVTMPTPPATKVGSTGTVKGSFQPPDVVPIPEVPESGWLNAMNYALSFTRARWQRRSAIRILDETIKKETTKLDEVLGTLGKQARSLGVDNRVLEAENQAIDEAEKRHSQLERSCAELSHRQSEEDRSFAQREAECRAKVDEAGSGLAKVEQELSNLEAQGRGLRDKRKAIDRQHKSYLKSAEEREEQAAKSSMADARAGLRRAAEDLLSDAKDLESEREDIDRQLADLERPMSQALARIEARKAELETARRSLEDAREGHRHRLAEMEAEQSRKKHELAQAGAEIQRRLVTLGTLVNLHRIERPEFDDLYERIDELRGAIGARSSEIDRLTAERKAVDQAALVRGFMVMGVGGAVGVLLLSAIIALIV